MTNHLPHNSLQQIYHSYSAPAAHLFPLPLAEQRCRWMEAALALLIEDAKAEAASTDSFTEVATLLETVPLATDDFSTARLHLQNAQLYCHEKEFGAACFELRQLRSRIDAL